MRQDLMKEEIGRTISTLTKNKVPEIDRYPAEWYKTFRDLITPTLLKCFNHTLKEGETPVCGRQAIISVIPKRGKDRTDCSPHAPISILNIDYRLYASILAKRLEYNSRVN